MADESSTAEQSFPIVGIGASAGGLKSVQRMLEELPADPGMAFVLIMHLSPDRVSHLDEVLAKSTSMPVTKVKEPVTLEANHLYVIAPDSVLEMETSNRLVPRSKRSDIGGLHPIDYFFRSLAREAGSQAVAVVLSGSGSDGAQGVREIKQARGLVLVQEPTDAPFPDMPEASISAIVPDLTASADQLGRELTTVIENSRRIRVPEETQELPTQDVEAFHSILDQLKNQSGFDFGKYKPPTLLRRMGRRMQITGQASLDHYGRYLSRNPDELRILYRDLLIQVTGFFRDPDVFTYLENEVIPLLFEGMASTDTVRVWVPACASGEEAYSLAMLLNEEKSRRSESPEIQLFATDVDRASIEHARRGRYPEAVTADVRQPLLKRYFRRRDQHFVVEPGIREQIIFAEHDILSDPPFARLDLIACRNLLIYLKPEQQKRLLRVFHFSLRDSGWLVLGTSESADAAEGLFSTVHKEFSVYRRRPASPQPLEFSRWARLPDQVDVADRGRGRTERSGFDEEALHRQVRSDLWETPSVLVDPDDRIVHLSGGIGSYLSFSEGSVPETIFDAVTGRLGTALRTALYEAKKEEGAETARHRVEVDRARGQPRFVNVRVHPLELDSEQYFLVLFEPAGDKPTPDSEIEAGEEAQETIEHLENELRETRRELQATSERYETVNEELRASNEELLSMNEELQSTTEELQTSKEELESMNEELTTVNDELNAKVEELNEAYADLENLMAAAQIPTLFLNPDLTIRRFTPTVSDVMNIRDVDEGRPLTDITTRVEPNQIVKHARAVLESTKQREVEVQADDDEWYLLRIRPYRTTGGEVEGVVLSFIDITERRRARAKLEALNEELEHRVQERTEELREEMDERKRLEREVLRTADQERYRLAERLHDNVAQELVGIRMMIKRVTEVLAEQDMDEPSVGERIATALDRTIEQTRQLSQEIVPVELEEGGLEDAVLRLQTDMSEFYNPAIEVEFGDIPSLPQNIATHLFRIIQEAVRNALQHADADTIAIVVERDDSEIGIQVRDDGQGVEGDLEITSENGTGLRIMRYRAHLVGASLTCEPRDGGGTTVTVRLSANADDWPEI